MAGDEVMEVEIEGGYVNIDESDYHLLFDDYRWYIFKGKYTYYAKAFRIINKLYTSVLMHRIILNCDKKELVDHKDGNGLNNRRDNIRIATTSQNMANARKRVHCSSDYKGVCFNKGKYVAQAYCNGKNYNLGRYNTEEEAARVYDIKATELFPE